MTLQTLVMDDITRAAAFTGLYLVIFLVAKWAKDCFTSYKINAELTQKDNLAVALAMSGYYLGTLAIFVGALLGPTQGLKTDLALVGGYALLGILFLNAARWLNDKLILRRFCDTKQLIAEKNAGVGIVHFGAYLATGLIAAGAVSGQGGGVLSAVVFFALGQLALILFSRIYERFSGYDVHEQLLQKNIASGVAFSGHLIALAIIIMNAAAGDFSDWRQDLVLFAVATALAFVFLPVIRVVMDRLVVPGDSLGREIREDRNIGAGALEATVAVSFAVVLSRLI